MLHDLGVQSKRRLPFHHIRVYEPRMQIDTPDHGNQEIWQQNQVVYERLTQTSDFPEVARVPVSTWQSKP